MKHLIALSMKYIRRQKMRTFLTFMCITLSAFILSTVCSYCSSIFQTLMNNTIDEDGSWELDISQWIENSDDKDKAFKAVANHAVVEKSYGSKEYSCTLKDIEVPQGFAYFEITAGGKTKRIQHLESYKGMGDIGIISGKYTEESEYLKYDMDADGVYVPTLFNEMGYSVGDTVTFTIRPVIGYYDEDSKIMKEVRAELKEKYGTEYTDKDPEYEELSKELQKKAYKGDILNIIQHKAESMNDIPVTDEEFGEPVEYTVKIAGFSTYHPFINTNNTDFNLTEIEEKNSDIYVQCINRMKIRLIDNCDYDEALKRLFTDLGFDYNTQFNDKEYFNAPENTMLLALEWKSPYAISQFMSMVIVPALIVLLIAWFVARFVIDNAFEMAVQERSTHFAALRVMGASKTQIAFIVFAEALFYCFTAVPLGTVLALLLCRSSFNNIRDISLPIFEFKASVPIMAIGVALCLIAILISAYTSAMWASRKLSPAEALNFGKPKSKKRRFRKSRSKLDLTANKFLKRYTKKNIKTAKSRFIVSTITMGLGVLMFTLTFLTGTYIKNTIKEALDHDYADMYILDYYSDDPQNPTAMPDKYFGDSEIFSRYSIAGYNFAVEFDKENIKKIKPELLSLEGQTSFAPYFIAINKGEYLAGELDKVTGMSYDDFVSSGGVLYNKNNIEYEDETNNRIEKYERQYLKTDNVSIEINGKKYKVIGTAVSPAKDGVLIPIEKSAEFNISYDITLRVSDYKHYQDALKLYNEFISKATYEEEMNAFMVGTGITEFIDDIIKIVAGFLVSIWLVGIFSMVNSVNTSVLNRSRELMMLRSVGMSRKQLRKSVILETIMFSSTAAVSGTALGVGGFLAFVFLLLEDKSAAVWGMVLLMIAISIIVNIVIALLAAIPAIKNLSKVESIAQAANG